MLLNRDLQKRPEVLRDSSPETNTGPYLVCEKSEFGIFHCPCSLLGVSDGRAISYEYRTQTVRFRSYLLPVLLTLLNWSTSFSSSCLEDRKYRLPHRIVPIPSDHVKPIK